MEEVSEQLVVTSESEIRESLMTLLPPHLEAMWTQGFREGVEMAKKMAEALLAKGMAEEQATALLALISTLHDVDPSLR